MNYDEALRDPGLIFCLCAWPTEAVHLHHCVTLSPETSLLYLAPIIYSAPVELPFLFESRVMCLEATKGSFLPAAYIFNPQQAPKHLQVLYLEM